MKGRTALVVLAIGVAVFVLYRVLFPSLTDEQQIERLLRWLERGFNRADAAACVRPLTADFRETSEGLSRAETRAALVYFFRENRDPETREPDVRAVVDPMTIEIVERDAEAEGGADETTLAYDVRCEVSFERVDTSATEAGRERASLAEVEIELVCVRDDGRFVIRRASHRVTSGRLP